MYITRKSLSLLCLVCQEVQGGADTPVTITPSTGQQPRPKKPAPVLPANAGDLFFEYTPAEPDQTVTPAAAAATAAPGGDGGDGGRGGKQGRAGAGKGKEEGEEESNRAPSPGGYTTSKTIFVVSFWFSDP